MFKREETGAAPGRDEGSVSATLVGQGTSFNGVLRVNGSLRVEGEVEGEVTVSQQVIVGTGGVIKADVRADGATIGGRVRGRVQA
ncbi:MAG: polymer-forming cytoskeletal protein, partial [Candidatus Eisenbacteria bacterium]|nr:polymer-forming cytoskeletal protein [Candidatus Eisenbacteria bacterium]